MKLIEYNFSAVSVFYSPCVGPIPKTNMCFFLLSICVEKFIPTPKINTFWPLGNKKLLLLSNPIPQPEYPYLSMSAF